MGDELQRTVEPVLNRIDAILGTGYSAVLYGSGVRGEYLPGVSDVNLLLVADGLPPGTLRQLAPALSGLPRADQSPPLLFEREEWSRASDVFPIEVTDLLHARQVLRGLDVVAGLRADPRHLRQALEGELRAKLIRLRQAYALRADDPRALGLTARRTAAPLAALMRVTLLLVGKPAPTPTPECLAAVEAALGISTAPAAEFWRQRGNRKFRCTPSVFEEYLSSVAALVRVIDGYTIPGGD